MSGISGFYGNDQVFDITMLYKMVESMSLRGNKRVGFYSDDFIKLAQNNSDRVVTNDKELQPIVSPCGRYVVAFSGEVLNRRQLVSDYSLNLRYDTDIEVVLELFLKKGHNFVKEINGDFIIALFDCYENTLWFYRDRIGISPLFYTQIGKTLIFGSELKSLVTVDQFRYKLTIDYRSVGQFFHLGYIPSPNTIYSNVFKLEQGAVLKCSNGKVEISKWWQIDDKKLTKTTLDNEQQAIDELDLLINDAVRLRSDGNSSVGTFLSGGIDSSLISAVTSMHTGEHLNTFCIKYANSKYDESIWAKKIARHIGSTHHEYVVTADDALEFLPKMIRHYDEPYADSSAIPSMLVSKMASQSVSVVLTGDGGDELFHGYGEHLWADRLNSFYIKTLRGVIGYLLSYGNSRMKRAAMMFKSNPHLQAHIFSQEQYCFSTAELDKLLTINQKQVWSPSLPTSSRGLTASELQAIYDILYYLSDDLLTKMDRASMMYGVKTRAPLLDYRVVEWSLNLNPALKIRRQSGKYILRKVLSRYLPDQLFNRPKQGFAVPLREWMQSDLRDMFLDYLSPAMLNRHYLVDCEVVERLKNEFYNNGADYLYKRLWLVAAFNMWFEQSYLNQINV